MVNITNPDQYIGIFDSPTFTVEVDSTEYREVEVLDSELQQLAVKRVTGQTLYTINVANYIRKEISVEPMSVDDSGFCDTSQRLAECYISLEGTTSAKATLSAASSTIGSKQLLTELPSSRTIAVDEIDELPFIAEAGVVEASIVMYKSNGIEYQIEAISYSVGDDKMVSYVVNVADLEQRLSSQYDVSIDDIESFDVCVTNNGTEVARVEYELYDSDSNRVRLCWINGSGAVDYYSFYIEGGSKVNVDKSSVVYGGSYYTDCSRVERVQRLRTEAIDNSMCESVMGVMSASNVWKIDDQGLTSLYVESDSFERSRTTLPIMAFDIAETLYN